MVKGPFRPDPSQTFVHGHVDDDDSGGEVMDEIDVILSQMRDKAAHSAREALELAGEAAGTVVIAEGIKYTKPIADLAAGFGIVLGQALAGAILGNRAQPPEEEQDDEREDDEIDASFYDEEDIP